MSPPDLTIFLSTHARPEVMRRAIFRLESCRRAGLELTVVVVDDVGDPETRTAFEEMLESSKLRLHHHVESSGGRGRALNGALREHEHGEVLLFLDDQLEPALDFFLELSAACANHPDVQVFGGRIEVDWPGGGPPRWASGERNRAVRELGFSEHTPRHDTGPYPMGLIPSPATFWIRRRLLERESWFTERPVSSPTDPAPGDEAQFLRKLSTGGQRIQFAARALTRRRITLEQLAPAEVRKRVLEAGRGVPHERGLPMVDLLRRSPGTWTFLRRLCVLRDRARVVWGRLGGMAQAMEPLQALGANLESLRMVHGAGSLPPRED